jgi:adenine-specific DNA-methyltransferase
MMSSIEKTLLPIITRKTIFGDIFAGSGIVGSHMQKHVGKIVANDTETYSYLLNTALLCCGFDKKIGKIIDDINTMPGKNGLVTEHFSPAGKAERMFFTKENAQLIDSARMHIENLKRTKKITKQQYIFLIASLLCSCTLVSNSAGHFRAFLKKFWPRARKKFVLKPIHKINKKSLGKQNTVFCDDALNVVKKCKFNVVYIDPPYTRAHYSAYYGFLNFLANYDDSVTLQGKGGVDPNYYKSPFGLKDKARNAFTELIHHTKSDHIMLSYNSDGIVPIKFLLSLLGEKGIVETHIINHKRYSPNTNVIMRKVDEYLIHVDCTRKPFPKHMIGGDQTKWIVHGYEDCPYCKSAKILLDSKNIEYDWFAYQRGSKDAEDMKNLYGSTTVPVIIHNGIVIGGYDDLGKLFKS